MFDDDDERIIEEDPSKPKVKPIDDWNGPNRLANANVVRKNKEYAIEEWADIDYDVGAGIGGDDFNYFENKDDGPEDKELDNYIMVKRV